MSNQTSGKTLSDWLKYSITFKLMVIGFMILIFLIPSFIIQGLIEEREETWNASVQEVSSKWGNNQVILGPVLTIPYKVYVTDKEGKVETLTKNAFFLPKDLNISGEMTPQVLNRSIYEVAVYNASLSFKGSFQSPDIENLNLKKEDILWEEAYVSVGISDMRGIKDKMELEWNGRKVLFNPGVESKEVINSGVSVKIPVAPDSMETSYNFAFNLDINGSRDIRFIPLGEETNVEISSPWNNPGFDGSFLPDKREVTAEGFKANWKILNLNRAFPQQWKDNSYNLYESSFGVNLLFPVEQYQKILRSAKYAILFIFLTFIAFFFAEVINKKRIHPLKYMLVGLGLIIFYTLLLSLSEHIGFNYAYLISSSAIIILITAYSNSFLKKKILVAVMGIIMTVLYVFLYSLLQLQDYALLMGSVGLFVVLALVMYFSRKIDYDTKINTPEANSAEAQ